MSLPVYIFILVPELLSITLYSVCSIDRRTFVTEIPFLLLLRYYSVIAHVIKYI